MHYSLGELINFHTCPGPCNYTAQKCYPSLSKPKGQIVVRAVRGWCSNAGTQKFHLLLPWHYLCRSLSVASASIVTILLAYNGFLYTSATGRLAKIILPSCLAGWQFRNKLPVEARRRLLIIEASHPVDLSSAFSFSFLFFPTVLQLLWQWKKDRLLGRDINPVLLKLPDANIKSVWFNVILKCFIIYFLRK